MFMHCLLLTGKAFALVSWPDEGDGSSVSVILATLQRVTGEFVVGERYRVTYGKKQHAAFVPATGLCVLTIFVLFTRQYNREVLRD